ncbi:MAG: methionyl-tRNA formyltransferase, partial [Gammaproteobacteria bacterium]|nr:methionyl-tRNA formyltransferase [Gammaproteobacteria bacterium]
QRTPAAARTRFTAPSAGMHASLLPALRGAAPVHWAIARGQAATGVTIMRMVKAMDAGPILRQDRTDILPDETAGELYERLARMGAGGLVRALEMMDAGTLEEHPQDHARATFAPRLSRRDARLQWARPAEEVARWMRAMDPAPGAWSELEGSPLKLFRPRVVERDALRGGEGPEPGTVIAADPGKGFRVATGEGSVEVGEVQPAGKRRMTARDWLRGRVGRAGQRLR